MKILLIFLVAFASVLTLPLAAQSIRYAEGESEFRGRKFSKPSAHLPLFVRASALPPALSLLDADF